jgi:hypothetical protein
MQQDVLYKIKIPNANLKLIDNLIVSPDTSTVYGPAVLTDLTANLGSFWIEAAIIICVLSVTE